MRTKRRTNWFFYIPFWLLIVAMVSGLVAIQLNRYQGYRQVLENVNAMLHQAELAAVDLEYQRYYYASDAFIEQLARERLNFIRAEEKLFVNIAP